jgi:hypothetical protein
MTRCIVLARMTRVTRDDEVQLRADCRRRRWCRRIRLHRRNLTLRCGAGTEVVRKRSPLLTPKTSGVHARNHRHNIGSIARFGNEVVKRIGESDLQGCLGRDRLLVDGPWDIFSLVEDIVVATVACQNVGPDAE